MGRSASIFPSILPEGDVGRSAGKKLIFNRVNCYTLQPPTKHFLKISNQALYAVPIMQHVIKRFA